MTITTIALLTLPGSGVGRATPVAGGILSFAEAILGVGLVLPGEAAITTLAATTAHSDLPILLLLVTLGAVLGDHLNYGLGRVSGNRLPQSRIVRRIGTRHWDRGVELMRTHGALSLVISRLIPVIRTLMPAVAGVAHLRYRTFLFASVVGSALWSVVWVAAGSLLMEVLRTHAGAVVVLGVVVGTLLVFALRRRRHVLRERAELTPASSRTAGPSPRDRVCCTGW